MNATHTHTDGPASQLPPARDALRLGEAAEVHQHDAHENSTVPRLSDIHRRLCRIEQLLELVPLLLAQVVDPTHLSIEGAARALHVSTKTIRRRIAAGTLTLEVIPGTRTSGIPIEQLFGEWIDLRTSRKAFERECREKTN